jgi:hypothetical protein
VTPRALLREAAYSLAPDFVLRRRVSRQFTHEVDVAGEVELALLGSWINPGNLPVLLVEIEERHNPSGLSRICELTGTLGYSIWFWRDGAWQSLAEFDAASDRDESELEMLDAGTNRREIRYFNNFLVLPPKHSPGRA